MNMTSPGTTRRRHSLRHPDHDYTLPGAYFVTICVRDRQLLFGHVADGIMHRNALGNMAHHCWPDLMGNHSHVLLDAFVVMPNHVHALLLIVEQSDGIPTPQQREFAKPIAGSISTLVGTYKAEVTRRARRAGLAPAGVLWQRNFWDRIVRSPRELERVRTYIVTNPQRWELDRLHPDAT